MKITEIRTIRVDEFQNLCYVQIKTDEGVTGLGETFFAAQAVESWIHENAAPILLGKHPLDIEKNWHDLLSFVGGKSTGAESRGRSALDIAAWDILGKVTGLPVYRLLGGKSRDGVPVYNTCAGYHYTQKVSKSGHPSDDKGCGRSGVYEDYDAFMNRADELALSLLEEGYSGMKIWPFDAFCDKTGGHSISAEDLKKGCEPFEKIRRAVGDRIDIMVELHCRWDLPTAKKIARALEPYRPFWYEDPILPYNVDALAAFARSTRVPTAASETVGSMYSYRDLCKANAADILIFDPTWTGGLTEAKKISAIAEAHELPITTHDCVGPLSYVVDTHISTWAPNAFVQETTRAFYHGWYGDLLTNLPPLKGGRVYALEGPGLGTELRPEVEKRPDATVRVSRL
ncbi:mandelate racemase/muconate lactonizing enzyme family protein [uncultured Oscillibacter sp.]|uniref:mandelate racemase/muconate lactonizing enzyme family protein n=1 Tax=uncultured Oscillibacter sp. TaxID=876091 RepID=UPI0028055ED5|nr:mandelate racemase/muconate lactonizing enzyme family protein [uncultured Oscillibacter sp.]